MEVVIKILNWFVYLSTWQGKIALIDDMINKQKNN
jgi:hypothetical protein